MNDFYPNQKISKSFKKNITKEMKSNHIIYDRNPIYMNFQSDIFYAPESDLDIYNSYNDDFYDYDFYNYYIYKNNSLLKSSDNYSKSVSYKNKAPKDNSKNYFQQDENGRWHKKN